MAWGCFSWIPCPYKKWNDEDRDAMVAMLPLVGTGLGLVTAVVWWVLSLLGAAPILSGAVVTGAYFVMTGFIHLDGFMDVADAVMPRHPKLEERRRILKDPHTGSFAAISMALMFLLFGASAAALSGADSGLGMHGGILGDMLGAGGEMPGRGMAEMPGRDMSAPGTNSWMLGALCLIAIVTTSRCVSAMTVISCKPMQTSQYVTTSFGKEKSLWKAIPALIITVIVVAACVLGSLQLSSLQASLLGGGLQQGIPGSDVGASVIWMLRWGPAICVLVSAAVCALTALIIGALDRRSLGGMNGDISGHMITSGEMAGMLAAAILIG